jgi:hypothetical protein
MTTRDQTQSAYDVTRITFADEEMRPAIPKLCVSEYDSDAAANPSSSFNADHYGRVAAARELKRRNGEM